MVSTAFRRPAGVARIARYARDMPPLTRRRASASVPASSANLGPGFDVVAIALALRCRVYMSPAAAWALDSPAADGSSMTLVRRAAEAALPGTGPFSVRVESHIPVGRGLGSSGALAAGVVAVVRAAAGLPEDRDEVVRIAAGVEGHPDNVAASVHGGAVAVGPRGRVLGLEVHPSLQMVVAVPRKPLPTVVARTVLADPVGTATAARTAARLAFLIEGLRRGDAALLAEAADDELHEARRAHLSPLTAALVADAREAGAAHAAWSGAGPSAVALVTRAGMQAVRKAWQERLAEEGGTVLEPGIDREGLRVTLAA